MTTATTTHTDQTIEVAGLTLRLLQGGSGDPVFLLHHSTGNPGWIPFYERLSEHFSVTVPDMPGYGQSERPEWAREPRDLAILMLQALDRLDLRDIVLVGFGLGGFIAAEAATMSRSRLKRLVLVGAAGLQPEEGEIMDQMLVDYEDYIKAGFRSDEAYAGVFGQSAADELKQLWDFSREMTARITWKPYMFNRRLAPLLREVTTPTLLVWGSEDVIVPPVCGQQYKAALPNARLEVIQGAGHLVEFEEPERLVSLIREHATS
ncbi:MAG: alpha/beta hydrolase [Dehalococcoidia bacterium]